MLCFLMSILNRFVNNKRFLFWAYQHAQHTRASGAVLAASRHYEATGNSSAPVNLGMLRNVRTHLSGNSSAKVTPEQQENNRRIKTLMGILNFVTSSRFMMYYINFDMYKVYFGHFSNTCQVLYFIFVLHR